MKRTSQKLLTFIPNVVLHELGHILNANGAFGANQFNAWFNLLEGHPGSREGMGAPDEDVLIGKKEIYRYQSERILPTLAQDIGIWDPDHVIFDELRDEFPNSNTIVTTEYRRHPKRDNSRCQSKLGQTSDRWREFWLHIGTKKA